MKRFLVTAQLSVMAENWEEAERVPYMIHEIPGIDEYIHVRATHYEEEIEDYYEDEEDD